MRGDGGRSGTTPEGVARDPLSRSRLFLSAVPNGQSLLPPKRIMVSDVNTYFYLAPRRNGEGGIDFLPPGRVTYAVEDNRARFARVRVLCFSELVSNQLAG